MGNGLLLPNQTLPTQFLESIPSPIAGLKLLHGPRDELSFRLWSASTSGANLRAKYQHCGLIIEIFQVCTRISKNVNVPFFSDSVRMTINKYEKTIDAYFFSALYHHITGSNCQYNENYVNF
jgi:hypothetical protein